MVHPIEIARRREVAARHQIDVRTLDRAIAAGADASVIRGMTADRVRSALVELGLVTRRPTRPAKTTPARTFPESPEAA